jgi:hypothetical protein
MPRRLLAVALAGAVALTGLAACRDQPAVAAYVGSSQLSNADVEKMVDEFPTEQRETDIGFLRQAVVDNFVVREVATRIAHDRGLPAAPVNVDAYRASAIDRKVDPKGKFVQLVAQANAALATIRSVGQPTAPTEADQRAVYQELTAAGILTAGTTFAQIKDQLDSDDMRAALGLRTVIADGVAKYGVTVNPRYQPLGIPVPFTLDNGQVNTEVDVPLNTSTASPAVVDAP